MGIMVYHCSNIVKMKNLSDICPMTGCYSQPCCILQITLTQANHPLEYPLIDNNEELSAWIPRAA